MVWRSLTSFWKRQVVDTFDESVVTGEPARRRLCTPMFRQWRDWFGSIEISCPPVAGLVEGRHDRQRGDAEGHADLDHGLRGQVADSSVQRVGVGQADVAVQAEAVAGLVGDRRSGIDLGQHRVGHLERWFEEVANTHGVRKVSESRCSLVDSHS